MAVSGIQASIYAGYGAAAVALSADTYQVYRGAAGQSDPTAGTPIAALPMTFTNAKLTGANFERGLLHDDIAVAALIDASTLELGDYLVGPAETFFIAGMDPMLPVIAVRCNRTISASRSLSELTVGGGMGNAGPSQFGGKTPFWGRREDAADNTPAIKAPACTLASAGRATSRSDMPSAAPGPSRWRIYLSPATFPRDSINDRDFLTDESGNRHMVEAAGWTRLGYRLETIRVEL